jgi:hypothetical protein
MAKGSTTGGPGRVARGPKSALARTATALLFLPIGVLLLLAAGGAVGAASYLGYLASRGTVFDIWAVLSILEALFSLAAIVGAGLAIRRRRLGLALAYSILALPMSFVIEGNRCDTEETCRLLGWAALPSSAGKWSVRIRPVTDANEARQVASHALARAGSEDGPYKEKRFADHWIVSTINQDGWPGAYAVRIDMRTAQASLVACPPEKIECGMERAVVSDGRRVFRNPELGVAATFPAGRVVCTSRSVDGDEVRGFYALVRPPDEPCDILDQSRQIGVELAPQRKNARTAATAITVPCGPLSAEIAKLFKGQGPTFPGRPSVACESRRDDDIQVSVYALAAASPNPGHAPPRLYQAWIVTTTTALAEDARAFEVFLRGVSIGVQDAT